jgi:hypothetical protein
VEVLVVPLFRSHVIERTRRVVRPRLEARFVNVEWRVFHAGRDDSSVCGEVDEFELEKLGIVVHRVDGCFLGFLTTFNRNGRVMGNGLVLIRDRS